MVARSDPQLEKMMVYYIATARMTTKAARALRERLRGLFEELNVRNDGESGQSLAVAVVMAPVVPKKRVPPQPVAASLSIALLLLLGPTALADVHALSPATEFSPLSELPGVAPAVVGGVLAWMIPMDAGPLFWLVGVGSDPPTPISTGAADHVSWLRRVDTALRATSILFVFAFALSLTFPADARVFGFIAMLGLAGVVPIVAHAAVFRPRVFAESLSFPVRITRAMLSPEHCALIRNRLLALMGTESPHHGTDLRLSDLAARLDIPPHLLSYVINREFEVNFFDFVNRYRVIDAKRLLADPGKRQYTILSIAHEVGFASKASFNRAFRKHAGLTPSEFQRQSTHRRPRCADQTPDEKTGPRPKARPRFSRLCSLKRTYFSRTIFRVCVKSLVTSL
jgi:AraC-like DNA-binding protein